MWPTLLWSTLWQAWVSFACKDASHLNDGRAVSEAVLLCNASPHVFAVGVNCTAPEHMPGFLEAASQQTARPLLVYPNSGEAWDGDKHEWKCRHEASNEDSPEASPDDEEKAAASAAEGRPFARAGRAWREAGASLIGGCCRVTPADIHALSASLRRGRAEANA